MPHCTTKYDSGIQFWRGIISDHPMKSVLKHFDPSVSFAFAYGSMVKKQTSSHSSKMIDLILAVDDVKKFHTFNLSQNPDHYSWIARVAGARFVTYVQRSFGGKIYFNPYVTIEDHLYKYGVISMTDLKADLLEWDTMYVSGRMMKPITILLENDHVYSWNQANLRRAVAYVLNQRGSMIDLTEHELFERITNISYDGDIRMGIGENPNKIKNIVDGNMEEFTELYRNIVDEYFIRPAVAAESTFLIPKFQSLPPLDKFAMKDIKSIVRWISIVQTIKGLFSAGMKSFQYLWAKRTSAKAK